MPFLEKQVGQKNHTFCQDTGGKKLYFWQIYTPIITQDNFEYKLSNTMTKLIGNCRCSSCESSKLVDITNISVLLVNFQQNAWLKKNIRRFLSVLKVNYRRFSNFSNYIKLFSNLIFPSKLFSKLFLPQKKALVASHFSHPKYRKYSCILMTRYRHEKVIF